MKIYRSSIQGGSREKASMLSGIKNKELFPRYASRRFAAAVAAMIFLFAGIAADAATQQKAFATPEDAVKAFAAALKSDDEKELLSIFGPAATGTQA